MGKRTTENKDKAKIKLIEFPSRLSLLFQITSRLSSLKEDVKKGFSVEARK